MKDKGKWGYSSTLKHFAPRGLHPRHMFGSTTDHAQAGLGVKNIPDPAVELVVRWHRYLVLDSTECPKSLQPLGKYFICKICSVSVHSLPRDSPKRRSPVDLNPVTLEPTAQFHTVPDFSDTCIK
jgi:hypothetical protein